MKNKRLLSTYSHTLLALISGKPILVASIISILIGCTSTVVQSSNPQPLTHEWQPLLDSNLSQWETWMGVPHSSITGLPSGTFKADNLNINGDTSNAMGLNNDVKNVFSVIKEQGEPVLKITGEIYGGLTTKASFNNYHLSMMIKWGEQKWAPRINAKRDSGVLFHCKGPHGAFWKVWKACQELQVQESDFGDYIPLAGPTGVIKSNDQGDKVSYHPDGKFKRKISGYSHAYLEPDYAHGEWNLVELYALDDKAFFVINDVLVMVIEHSKDGSDEPLTSGQIQIQSEGAALYYKQIKIKSINAIPSNLLSAAKL